MKVIIGIEEELSSIEFLKDNKQIQWGELSREEQNSILNAIASHYHLFSRFLKQEN